MTNQVGLGSEKLEWPYPIKYDTVNHITVDVLVVGGGLAGCSAGIAAARNGLKVAIADKAPIKRSGNGGAGMDHWNLVLENPKSPMSVEEFIEHAMENKRNGNFLAHRDYIADKGTWDALMELEKLGLPIRDEDGDFDGMPTQDEDLKILKAYNYRDIISVKLRGGNFIKPVLYEGAKKEGVQLFDRVMMTSLLTEGGKQGSRVVGATGFSMETGEFYVFHTKSVILSTGYACSMWIYSMEITGNSFRWDPNEIGEGLAMAYNAGAQVYGFFKNGGTGGSHPFAWPRFGVGNSTNTWHPCTIVDDNGKEVPWVDADGNPISEVADRNMPSESQRFMAGGPGNVMENIDTPHVIRDVAKLVEEGVFQPPFWADISSMPEKERRSIWGMMVGNEGKTRYTLYDLYTRLGFNPDKHLLWVPIESHKGLGNMHGERNAVKPWRSERSGQGELVTDWNGMTSVGGVFAAGATSGLEGCALACSSGFYAGNRAAEYAQEVTQGEIDEAQLKAEHDRVYAPVKRAEDPDAYISWKELWGGTSRVMQVCCAEYLTIPVLKFGVNWLDSIRRSEAQHTYARNPHEMARVLECETRITVSDLFMRACISKIEAEDAGIDPKKFIFNQLVDGEFTTTYKEEKYWLKPPYAPTYLENYMKCRAKELARKERDGNE